MIYVIFIWMGFALCGYGARFLLNKLLSGGYPV